MPETDVPEEPQPQPQAPDLLALLGQLEQSPPDNLSAALAEHGVPPEALEEFARTAPPEEVERLRRVLVQGAASEEPENAALLARMTPAMDPRERAWDRLIRARNNREILTALVTEATKGGVVVDLGVRGFVPASQIGLNQPKNTSGLVGQQLRLRVLEVDRRKQSVVLTNRQILEEERAARRREAFSRIEAGAEITGTVRRLTHIGAFVDVGGIDGLLHVSEIAWRRVERPADHLKVNQKVQVKVLRVDPETMRISLSMKALVPDPWAAARERYQPGSTVRVRIARTIAQGAVVELEEGLDGFLPISELAPRRVASVEEVVQAGQEVDLLVIEQQPRERRIVFSLKKLEQKRDRALVDTYQKKERQRQGSDRTTLGDLFGHLFQEMLQPEPEPEPMPEPEPVPEPEPPVAEAAPPEKPAAARKGRKSKAPAGSEPGGSAAVETAPAGTVSEATAAAETQPAPSAESPVEAGLAALVEAPAEPEPSEPEAAIPEEHGAVGEEFATAGPVAVGDEPAGPGAAAESQAEPVGESPAEAGPPARAAEDEEGVPEPAERAASV